MNAPEPPRAVCVGTLYEGHYHLGLAALVNSLVQAGHAGPVVAGMRGALPAWARHAVPSPLPAWPQARRLAAGPVALYFVPLDTPHHLTNHKPDFMLALLDGGAGPCDAVVYLDPDICVARDWRFFEQWLCCGVALCEDVNSPLPERHPRRVGWRRFFAGHGLALRFRGTEYVNGGFVGVRQAERAFLQAWQQALAAMGPQIGGLDRAKVEGGQALADTGFAGCFDCGDQDALNAACEATELPLSVIGPEAMGFKPGALLLPHAVGRGKPWQRFYLRSALAGRAPAAADKAYWRHADGPLQPYAGWLRRLRRLDLGAAAALGRVVRRT